MRVKGVDDEREYLLNLGLEGELDGARGGRRLGGVALSGGGHASGGFTPAAGFVKWSCRRNLDLGRQIVLLRRRALRPWPPSFSLTDSRVRCSRRRCLSAGRDDRRRGGSSL